MRVLSRRICRPNSSPRTSGLRAAVLRAAARMDEPEWKRIQKKTFTRWCNEQLRVRGMVVDDLTNEFSDGLKLIALLEVLSHQKFRKYNKKPRIHAQKIENVTMALAFLREEKVKLVNIGKEEHG